MRFLIHIIAVVALSITALAVAVDEKPLADPVQEARARELMKEVRCLVCQNQSIEDSNAQLAKDLRLIVREQVAAGKNDAEIKAFLVERYGDWVLLKPPLNMGTVFLWGSPIVFLVLLAWGVIARRRVAAAPVPLTAEEEAELKAILADKGDKT